MKSYVPHLFLLGLANKTPEDIVTAFRSIPIETREVLCNALSLHLIAGPKLADGLRAMPSWVWELDLSFNWFNQTTGLKLAKTLEALPLSVRKLDLSMNRLDLIGAVGVAQALTALPKSLRELDLSTNSLGQLEDVNKLIRAIPLGVKKLDLGRNSLNLRGGRKLAKALQEIPDFIEELVLSHNELSNIKKLAPVLKSLSKGVRKLDLTGNHLGRNVKLKAAMAAIPKMVKTLNLSDNCLNVDAIPALQLADVIRSISGGVASLVLQKNKLSSYREALSEVFQAIPEGVSELDLSENGFEVMDGPQLIAALEGIPTTVKKLILRKNMFSWGPQKLGPIFKAIPEGCERA